LISHGPESLTHATLQPNIARGASVRHHGLMSNVRPLPRRPPAPPRWLAHIGLGTRVLLAAVLVSTLAAILVGPSQWLVAGPATLTAGALSALFTNAFVTPSAHPDALFMPLFLFAMLNLDWLRAALSRNVKPLLLGLVATIAVGVALNAVLPGAWGLVAGLLLVAFFGPRVEAVDGPRRFLTFSIVVALATSLLASVGHAVAPWSVGALIGDAALPTTGLSPLIGAWLALLTLGLRGVRLDVLNLDGAAFFWLLVAMDVYTLLFQGVLAGAMGLLGLALAWRRVGRGAGRGGRRLSLMDRWRLWRLEQRRKRFKVVRGGPTLHRTLECS